MIDELQYPNDYIEELENELKALRVSHNELTTELSNVYGSKAYRAGNLARVAYKNPTQVIKKVARVVKNTGRLSPKAFRHFRAATPHNSAVVNSAYKRWQKDFEPNAKELARQRAHSKTLKKQPLFSIITPVFNPPKDVLIELITSVTKQTYPNFELCLGEFSGNPVTREVLEEYAAIDNRLKIKFFDKNEGISVNSNHCLELASGDYIGLLDHDDSLSPDALYENALLINSKDYDFIYSDKDKIDESGNRFDPMFKPDWSPELMLTANYLTHFNVFKKSILNKIGGWDKATDGAQDWDLFFRLIAKSKNIGHIPKVLYHWRVIATSTAMSISTKPYALGGQKRAIIKYAKSLGIAPPKVVHSKAGALNLEWGLVAKDKVVHCIIMASADTIHSANILAKKLAKTDRLDKSKIEIYLNDNPAHDLGKIILSKKIKSDILLFVDAKVSSFSRKNWLDELTGWLTIPGVGIASPQVYSKYGVFLEAGRVIGLGSSASPLFAGGTYIPGIFGYREWSRNVSMPSIHCFVVNTDVITGDSVSQPGIQGLRELALISVQSGHRTVVTPFVSAVVNSSAIYESAMSPENQGLIKKTLPNLEDPFFSTNLSTEKKYPIFLTAEEAPHRRKVIEQWLDRPIEYDPAVAATDSLYSYHEQLPLVGYKRDSYILSGIMDCSPNDVTNSQGITYAKQLIDHIDSALWILPNFTTLYAGLKNIFALAAELSKNEQTKHTFYITTQDNINDIKSIVLATYPVLVDAEYINSYTYDEIADTSSYTIGISSLWTTAYTLLKNNNLQRKFYIIQDDERAFYPRGSMYGLVNATYDFGFWGIAGTRALADWYESRQRTKNTTVVLGSDLELSSYLKAFAKKGPQNKVPRVLFYARPDAPRNGFEIGVHALNKLAENMSGEVDIVLAGANFDLGQYEGLHTSIRTAGKVSYTDLPEFYASFDASLFLMFSEHPGVFPLEMMASSVPVVINKHHNASWKELYIDGKTCLTSEPTPTSIAEALGKVLSNTSLREALIKNGRQLAEKQSSFSYSKRAKATIKFMKTGKNNDS